MLLGVFNRGLVIAREYDISQLNFFGGEPLLNPHFFPMLAAALEQGYQVLLNTNCYLLSRAEVFTEFCHTAGSYTKSIQINTSADRYHLQVFNPYPVVDRLQAKGFPVYVNTYTNQSIILTTHNRSRKKLFTDTSLCCCFGSGINHPGILPDGSWTLCSPSLLEFSNINQLALGALLDFSRSLCIPPNRSCTVCLKKFPVYRKKLKRWLIQREH